MEVLLHKPREEVVHFYDPYNVGNRVRATVNINARDLEGKPFSIVAVQEFQQHIGTGKFSFTDYVLKHTPTQGDPIDIVLRTCPVPGQSGQDRLTILLWKEDEEPFSKDIYSAIQDGQRTGQFNITDDDNTTREYFRCHDHNGKPVKLPYSCTIANFGFNGDVIDPGYVTTTSVTMWDFMRDVTWPGDIVKPEYLFIQMDGVDKYIKMLVGYEINESRVTIV